MASPGGSVSSNGWHYGTRDFILKKTKFFSGLKIAGAIVPPITTSVPVFLWKTITACDF